MATKRKLIDDDNDGEMQQLHISNKKHTLDSDEEDSDDYEKDKNNASDVEGEEEGESNVRDEVKITPFNMREEMQEGHFDVDGTYHWDKDEQIKDNWLDNIDWVKVEKDKNYLNPNAEDSSENPPESFNETHKYNALLEYMQPGETVQQTLQRLGKSRVKISSTERIRRKKLGIVDEAAEKITKFTELANELLTKTGNMDIYQETFEEIKRKQKADAPTSNQSAKPSDDSFDMYADDFGEKEQNKLNDEKSTVEEPSTSQKTKTEIAWEFKWKQEDDAEINGPYTTKQMHKWSEENYFKGGVYVRKVGEQSKFYTSNRIDFDLYL